MMVRRGRRSGLIRLALVYGILLTSLYVVVWRQSRALEVLRGVDALRREGAVLAAERATLVRRLEHLRSRSRIVGYARRELGMHIPASGEVVMLRWPERGMLAEASADRERILARARAGSKEQAEPEPPG